MYLNILILVYLVVVGNSEYNDETGKQFAYAYKREELKAKDCNPDILAQQNGKEENPHKTKHIEANDKALGYSRYSSYPILMIITILGLQESLIVNGI